MTHKFKFRTISSAFTFVITVAATVALLIIDAAEANAQQQVTLALDQYGYPQQGFKHEKSEIIFPKLSSVGTFGWIPDEDQFNKIFPEVFRKRIDEEVVNQLRRQVIPLKNVTSTIEGQWLSAKKGRQGDNDSIGSIAVSSSKSISKSNTFQLGAELSTSTTVGFKPFGVGADVTMEASIGYAFSQSSAVTNSRTWNPSFPLELGQDVQIWQRVIRISDSFDPARIFQPKPGETHTAEEAFLLAMGEAYGPILWPHDEYGFDSYAQTTIKPRFNELGVSSFKRALQQKRNPVANHVHHFGEVSLWRTLEIFFDYSEFANLGFQDRDRYLPSPEYYPTYSNFNSPKQPTSVDLKLIMTGSAGSPPELNQAGYPVGGKRYSTFRMGASQNVVRDTYRWVMPTGSLKKMMFKQEGKSEMYKAVNSQYQKEGLFEKIKELGVLLPNVETVANGSWTLAGNQRCPSEAPEPISLTASNAIEVSSETAHEVSVGFSVSATGAGKPLGVGAETTLTASVNAAMAIANGTGSSEEWSRTESVKPGDHMYMWQQFLSLSTVFTPSSVFADGSDQHGSYTARDAFVCAFAESYGDTIWPQIKFGPRSYKDLTRDLRQNGPVSITLLIRRLNQENAPGLTGDIKNLKTPLSSIIFTVFDFDEFKKIEKQRFERRLPFPEFYPTRFDYKNIESQSPAITAAPTTLPPSNPNNPPTAEPSTTPVVATIASLPSAAIPDETRQVIERFQREGHQVKWVAFAPNGGWSVLYGKNGYFNRNIPDELHQLMVKYAQEGRELKSVAFAPNGGWSLLYDKNGYFNRNAPDELHQLVVKYAQEGRTLKTIAYAPNGGWSLFYDKNGYFNRNVPDELHQLVVKYAQEGRELKSVAYAPSGGWSLFYDKNGYFNRNVPDPAHQATVSLSQEGRPLRTMAFSSNGGWIVVSDK